MAEQQQLIEGFLRFLEIMNKIRRPSQSRKSMVSHPVYLAKNPTFPFSSWNLHDSKVLPASVDFIASRIQQHCISIVVILCYYFYNIVSVLLQYRSTV